MLCRFGSALAGCVALSAPAFAEVVDCAEQSKPHPEIAAASSIASDYIYRGTTLSAHRPTAGSDIAVRFGDFYASAEVQRVKLPTDPVAEISFVAGACAHLSSLDLDFSVNYFSYPREIPGANTDYWEATLLAVYEVLPKFTLNGQFSWSPDISGTGAWSRYVEAGFGYDLPMPSGAPEGLGVTISAGVARYWFGQVAPDLGDFRLPAYTYWHAGIEFTFDQFSLELSYHDTNLSKENCFVFTGDPTATPGGIVNGVTNPDGLRSRWCGAAFVATATIALEPVPIKLKKH